MGVVPEDSDGIYSPSSGLLGARELTLGLSMLFDLLPAGGQVPEKASQQ